MFACYVAIIPPGNYTCLGLLDRVQTAVTAAAGTMALTGLASAGRLQFQYDPAFVIKLPTATELADPTWKAADWDTAIVPAGEVNPSSYTTPNSFTALMTLPATPGHPVVGAKTFTPTINNFFGI